MYLSSHMNTLSSSLPTVLTSQHLLSSPFFHFSSGRSPEAVMRDRMRISLTIQSQIQSSVCSLNVHTYKHSLSLQSHSLFPASLWCDSGHLTIWLWEFEMNEFKKVSVYCQALNVGTLKDLQSFPPTSADVTSHSHQPPQRFWSLSACSSRMVLS